MHCIYLADSRHMPELEDASVHLVLTSPPYWQLKDYGSEGQIGYHDSYEEYLADLNQVWGECARVLHPGCRLCVNIGDQFARAAYYGRSKIIPIREAIVRHCEGLGLDYMGAIIWQKLTTCNTTGGGSVMGSYPYPRNGAIMIDYEFILVFKKPGKAPAVSREVKEASRLTHEQWCEYFAGHWRFPGERQNGHLAAFPEELPRRLIRMYSFVGERVLDPFLGSGTTVKVAAEEGRVGLGFEINRDFRPVIERKLDLREEDGHLYLPLEAELAFVSREGSSSPEKDTATIKAAETTIRRLVDPKTIDFGSRIDGRTRSGKLLLEVARSLSAEPAWPALTEGQRMGRILEVVVARTGADRSLARLGIRNALLKLPGFAELVRG